MVGFFISCLDFFFKTEREFADFSAFFASCELSGYLYLDKFECENGEIGVTIDTLSSYISSKNDGWNEDDYPPATDDEVAAMILFREELHQKHPEIRYS
ncbi:MAG TPA: hypothetical protein PKA63_02745 [Oligoflexia bacterium]|nr:hypothetical protein [Oligoflexia bacterium]HMP47571.1 hypothetical protein [Oligoflexia bacterium]